ncbi:MAG: transcriptional regulator, TetR family [Nocardia sp.]|uniref:TetR/AcrR family transcriptional regulator n=1 Tax=Nocardia sp. TaxID=1821 RepID=UPI002629227E|nr:TetR/AcrR family transcriptional regulator [Nocardia sp.]MCU1640031.1 transcriptional regulator, TetR family [Nocardia sp.]
MTRTRMTASERGEEVLQAAVVAFAQSGYAATKTDEIARLAGVSQPYVIRLFGTKQQLFLAAVNHSCDRIEENFRVAASRVHADATPEERLAAIGPSYTNFLNERELPLILLHGFAASADPTIGTAVRTRFGGIYQIVRELTGASVEEVRMFMAMGMLLTDMTAMQLVGPDAIEMPWAAELIGDYGEA